MRPGTLGILNQRAFTLRRRRLLALAAAGVGIVINQRPGRAITATWNGTTDSNWATNTDWSSNTAPGSTSSTTNADTAIFNNAGNGNTSITVDSNRNIDNIMFDTANAAAYTFSGGSLLGTSGGEILMTPAVNQSETFNTPLTIESSKGLFSLINNSSNAAAVLNYAGTIEAASGGTLYLGGTNPGQNIISGAITNGSSPTNLVVNGASWKLSGNETYTGYTFVTGGTMWIANTFTGSFPISAYNGGLVTVTGTVAKGGLVPGNGGIVELTGNGQLGSSSIFIQNGGNALIENAPTIVNDRLNGDELAMAGGAFSYLSGTGANSDQIGALLVAQGANTIYLDANSGGSTVITAANIDRDTQSNLLAGTLLIVAPKLGQAPGAGVTNLLVSAAGTGVAPIGGGGAAGSTNISIESFAVVDDNSLTGNAQYNFVTGIGSANGLRGLTPSEYTGSITDGADTIATLHNVSLYNTTATVNASQTTINALRLDNYSAVAGAGTLTVNSGAILSLLNNYGISVANLNFNSQEGIFDTIGDLNVSGNITGSGGLTKTGAGTLYFSSASPLSYTGATTVNQGMVRLGAANQLSSAYPIYLMGGSLDMNGFGQTIELASGLYAGTGSSIVNSNNATTATLTLHAASAAFSQYRGTIGATGQNNIAVNVDTGGIGLLLSHSSTYTSPTTISSGVLGLDFSEPDSVSSNILPSTTHLYCGGVLAAYQGPTADTQTLSGVTMEPGPGGLVETGYLTPSTPAAVLPAGSTQISLGALTRVVGAAADLGPGTNGSGFSTSSSNSNGIIGGWAVIGSTDWAVANGSGDIYALPTYTNDAWSAGANVTVTTNSTQISATANSLRFGLAQTNTVSLSGVCTLASGGILVDYYNGANLNKIQGGTLEGAAGADLVVNNFDMTANSGLEIDSTIANNSSATGLTLIGGGTLALTAANTYTGATYIDYGTLKISSNANLGAPAAGAPIYLEYGTKSTLAVSASFALDNAGSNPRPIIIGGFGGQIDVPSANTLTIDGVISGSPLGVLNLNDSGRVILSNAANTFAGTLNGGNLVLASANAAQDMTLQNQSSLNFSSGISTFYVGGLAGGGTVIFENGLNPFTTYIGGNNQSTTYTGYMTPYGPIDKIGTGTTTINGNLNNAFFGLIDSGTLAFGGSAALPTQSYFSNNATLDFDAGATGTGINVQGHGTMNVAATVSIEMTSVSQGAVVNNGYLRLDQGGSFATITGDGTLGIGVSSTTGTVQLGTSTGVSSVGALSIYAGSKLDIRDDSLIIDYGSNPDPIASIAALLASGYVGGAWNGPGIDTSAPLVVSGLSYGIGYADSADPGNPAGLPSGTIEIKYTLLGDADLNGIVNGIDFGILAANFNKGVTGWDEGDFDYNNIVNGLDFGDLAANFNKGAAGASEVAELDAFAAANGLLADVPEPTGGAVIVTAAAGFLARRRKRIKSHS